MSGDHFKIFVALAFVVLITSFFIVVANASQQDFNFTTPGNYSFDTSLIQVSGGVASLLQGDQTDNDNTSTGFGGGTDSDTQFDGGNNWVELTGTGMTNGTGNFTSRIIDAGGDVAWDAINWETERPVQKELPNNEGVETAYTSGNSVMTGNRLLLHMNESSWNGTTGEVIDSSGQNNHGTRVGDATTTTSGKFNNGGTFDGTGDYILIPDDSSLEFTNQLTIAGWYYYTGDIGSKRLLEKGSGFNTNIEYRMLNLDGGVFGQNDSLITQLSSDGTNVSLQTLTNGALASFKDQWVFIASTYDGSTLNTYVNASVVGTASGSITLFNGNGNLAIGADETGTFTFGPGMMDEVGLWNRALQQTELEDMYKRGMLRLQHQVRSCDDAACSGESFIGPDGTGSTFYSELSNSSIALPSLSLTNVPNNRYFQYQSTFETDDVTLTPELKSVQIGPDHYNAGNPTISNTTGIRFSSLLGFTETLGGGNAGTVEYQLSNDGVTYYYHNGSTWVTETGLGYPSQTNTAAEVSLEAAEFTSGTGDFFFRAFLHSDLGTQVVELDQVSLTLLLSRGGQTTQLIAPQINSFLINDDLACTPIQNVMLQLDVVNAEEMLLSTTPDFLNSTWEPYSNTKSWTLSETNGFESVYAIFRSSTQNLSSIVSDMILVDTTNACLDPESFPDVPETTIPTIPDEIMETSPDLTPPPVQPTCTIECSRLEYDLYIVNPDGTERHMDSEFVRIEQINGDQLLYIEDKGADFDFNDLVIKLNSTDCSEVVVSPVVVNAAWRHQIRMKIFYDGVEKQDLLLWADSQLAENEVARINIFDSPTICLPELDVVPVTPEAPAIPEAPEVPVSIGCKTTQDFVSFLTIGVASAEVRALQELLQCLEYFPAEQPSTAFYGPITQEAVRDFQEANGIIRAGYVGPATREALNSYRQ